MTGTGIGTFAALTTLLVAASTLRRATTPWSSLPDSDYWGNISGLITESGVRLTLANLFRHNNEHIVVVPKLIYAANYLATSGSNTGAWPNSCGRNCLVQARGLLFGTAAVALLVGLGLAFCNAPKAKPDLAFDLVGLIEFVLIYLGNALTTGPLRIVAGLVILAAGLASIWRLAAERRIEETLLWVILFFFAPFNALMTGIGRLG